MAKLVVITRALAGLSHELGRQWVTIGRAAGNAFQIVETSVSGHHCEVQFRDNELVVRDLRSTNGTLIGGKLATDGVVKPGEIFRLGEVELRFESSAPVLKIEAASPSPLAEKSGPPGPRKSQILLVDDSMAFLESISELFGTLAAGAWEVHKASAADEALSILQHHRMDLAVFDLGMPLLDGLQLLGIVHKRYPGMKKVILTGNATEAHRSACLANGAELFLEKPTTSDGIRFVFNVLKDLIVWHQREGFTGTLRHVGLSDVIQIQCLSRNSCILGVHNPRTQGEIFFQRGVILHATADELEGEAALFKLLAMNHGEFHLKPFANPPARTVEGSWEFLIMEAARMRDEERSLRVSGDTVLVTRPAGGVPAPAGSTAPESPVAPSTADAIEELSSHGEEIVVVSTYDGDWHPSGGTR
jgi:CheY-like chemotaxis protein